MCIGGHYTMDRHDAAIAADLVKAQTVIPCHYDTFPPIETDAQAFKADVESHDELEGRRARAGGDPFSVTHAIVLVEAERTALPDAGRDPRRRRGRRRGVLRHRRVGLRRDRARAQAGEAGRGGDRPDRPARGGHPHADDGRLRGVLKARPRGDVLGRRVTGRVPVERRPNRVRVAGSSGSWSWPLAALSVGAALGRRRLRRLGNAHRREHRCNAAVGRRLHLVRPADGAPGDGARASLRRRRRPTGGSGGGCRADPRAGGVHRSPEQAASIRPTVTIPALVPVQADARLARRPQSYARAARARARVCAARAGRAGARTERIPGLPAGRHPLSAAGGESRGGADRRRPGGTEAERRSRCTAGDDGAGALDRGPASCSGEPRRRARRRRTRSRAGCARRVVAGDQSGSGV